MTSWHRLALAGLVVALGIGILRPGLVAQESPMTVTGQPPQDDEPEAQPAPQAPLQPGAPPPVLNVEPGRRFPVVDAPLPPPRPFFGAPDPAAAPRAPATATPAPPAGPVPATPGPASPAPPAVADPVAPVEPPATAALPDEPEIELTPNMRINSLPVVTQQTTTAEIEAEEARTPEPTHVEKQTDAVDIACLQPDLLKLVKQAGDHFGATPVITSGQRTRGRRNSYHRRCMAADFFVPGIERARLAQYLRTLPGAGGVGTYCHTKSVHIDVGEPRNWWQCGFRFRFAQR